MWKSIPLSPYLPFWVASRIAKVGDTLNCQLIRDFREDKNGLLCRLRLLRQ